MVAYCVEIIQRRLASCGRVFDDGCLVITIHRNGRINADLVRLAERHNLKVQIDAVLTRSSSSGKSTGVLSFSVVAVAPK
jgi:hypothetical protein